MKCVGLLLGCLLVVPLNLQAGELYRWLGSDGKVHYGDLPPNEPTQVEAIELPPAPPPSLELPYETRRAQQNFPVTLYVAENCAEYCESARKLLNKRGIPFTEKMLVTKEEIDAFKALSGADSIPVLAVGKNFLKGFSAEQWQTELDVAGYPQTAPYRPANLPEKAASPEQTDTIKPVQPNNTGAP